MKNQINEIKNTTEKKVKSFWTDFKKFISRGSVIDLAIAVVIGGAFSKIITSLVNDIIMPLISLATGGTSISDLKWVIQQAVYDVNGVVLVAENAFRYGAFLQSIIDFLIISFFIFVVFKILNASTKRLEKLKEDLILKRQITNDTNLDLSKAIQKENQEAQKVLTDAQRQELLLTEIRDLLKANSPQNEQITRRKKDEKESK